MTDLSKYLRIKFEAFVSIISILFGVSCFVFGKGDTWIGVIPILSGALLLNHAMRIIETPEQEVNDT